MLSSALNFAIGFFGYPIKGKYEQSITIEANGVRVLGLLELIAHKLKLMTYSSTTPLLLMKRMYSYLLFYSFSDLPIVIDAPMLESVIKLIVEYGTLNDGMIFTFKMHIVDCRNSS